MLQRIPTDDELNAAGRDFPKAYMIKHHHAMFDLFGPGVWLITCNSESGLASVKDATPVYHPLGACDQLLDVTVYKRASQTTRDIAFCAISCPYVAQERTLLGTQIQYGIHWHCFNLTV